MSKLDRIDTSLPNLHHVIIGVSGSGKSSWLRKHGEVKNAKRLLVWDPDEDYRITHVSSVSQLHKVFQKVGFGPVRVGLTCAPTMENFGQFCAIAFAVCHAAAPLSVIVEELADVTTPAKAAQSWGELIRKSRKYGGRIFATSQRPQEIDKTIFSQAAYKWCGVLSRAGDRKYMAQEMDLPVEALASLAPLEYFLRHGINAPERGKVKF